MRHRWRWAIAAVGVIYSVWLVRRLTTAPPSKDIGAVIVHDDGRAVQAWTEACDQGSAPACVWVAEVYAQVSNEPNAVGRDDAQAARYFRKGCDGKNAGGCAGLSRLYRAGRGVPKDPEMARQLLKRALELTPRMRMGGEIDTW
jgi:TPR repeat protein